MRRNNFIGRMQYNFRRRTGYNVKKQNKSFYRKQFRNLLVCIVIVLVILMIKKIDTKPTREAIEIIKDTLNYDTNILKDSKKVVDYVKGFFGDTEQVTSVFNFDSNENSQYTSPVSGTVYQSFGEEKKSKDITIFHKGIEIQTFEDSVRSIGDGVVLKIKSDKLLGTQIVIDYGEIQATYGHLAKVFVEEGASVKKGKEIAALENGREGKKFLYFEIRENNVPINPLQKISITSNNLVAR